MSGLITPSLDEMVAIAAEMERRGMKIPLLLGGATTSKAHTAVKVQPQYSGPVVHAADASQGVLLVNALMNPDTRDEFIAETQAEYAAIRAESGEKHAPLLSLEEARANAFRPDWSVTPNEMPRHPGITDLAGEPLEEIIPYIDWDMFLNTWEIDTEAAAHTREELMRDARALLEKSVWKNCSAVPPPPGFIRLFPFRMTSKFTGILRARRCWRVCRCFASS